MKKIRTGDNAIVIAGKWKGSKSTVVSMTKSGERVILQGVNTAKKAVKGQGFVEKDMPIHVSNIALFDTKSGSASSVGIKDQKGKKVRFYKKSGELVKK